jgi:hypothetical protein
MKQKIRLEIELAVDEGGNVQAQLISSKRLNDREEICFVTGKSKLICNCSQCAPRFEKLKNQQTESRSEIEIFFTHPRDAKTFTAFVSPQCTGKEAIRGLIVGDADGPFLDQAPPQYPYELFVKQSGVAITSKMTFAEAGISNGDVIEVRQSGQGGGIPWDAIQLSIAYGIGTGAGLAIVKALGPIVQQIVKNRGTRSVEIEVAGKRIKLVGKNSIREAITAIAELAHTYGYDESAGPKPRRTASKIKGRSSASGNSKSQKATGNMKRAKTKKASTKDVQRRRQKPSTTQN